MCECASEDRVVSDCAATLGKTMSVLINTVVSKLIVKGRGEVIRCHLYGGKSTCEQIVAHFLSSVLSLVHFSLQPCVEVAASHPVALGCSAC